MNEAVAAVLKSAGGQTVLSGGLTINCAEAVRDQLARDLAACERLTLDTLALDAVDAAGIQLIIAARRSAERVGKRITLAPAPAGVLLAALVVAGFRPGVDGGGPDAGQDGFWWGKE